MSECQMKATQTSFSSTTWWLLPSPWTQSCRSVIVSTSEVGGEEEGKEEREEREERRGEGENVTSGGEERLK